MTSPILQYLENNRFGLPNRPGFNGYLRLYTLGGRAYYRFEIGYFPSNNLISRRYTMRLSGTLQPKHMFTVRSVRERRFVYNNRSRRYFWQEQWVQKRDYFKERASHITIMPNAPHVFGFYIDVAAVDFSPSTFYIEIFEFDVTPDQVERNNHGIVPVATFIQPFEIDPTRYFVY